MDLPLIRLSQTYEIVEIFQGTSLGDLYGDLGKGGCVRDAHVSSALFS
jgi:hypothetical protein